MAEYGNLYLSSACFLECLQLLRVVFNASVVQQLRQGELFAQISTNVTLAIMLLYTTFAGKSREGGEEKVTNTVAELLDAEFRRLAAQLADPSLLTVRGQADYLGISPGHLSRVRRGEISLTRKLAQTIADKVKETISDREDVLLRLLTAATGTKAPPTSELMSESFVAEMQRFFEGLQGAACLLCIDYRDFPQAEQRAGRYPNLLESLARAVRDGLAVAMFQPFANKPVERFSVRGLSTYIDLLQSQVRLVHRQLLSLAGDSPEIRQRVVLYERDGSWNGGSGLGSRTMYLERKMQNGSVKRSVYEWVVGEEFDSFLERDSNQLWPEAFGEQFFPVVDFWRTDASNKLPSSAAALKQAAEAPDWSVLSVSKRRPDITWAVAIQ